MTTHGVLDGLLDPGTFRSWDDAPASTGPVGITAGGAEPSPEYAADLARARGRTGLDESVLTGEGWIGGHPVAVAVSEFGFLGGSIGVVAGERLTRAVERATAGRLPLIALPASGGTRMQEGTLAFLQMVKITGAVTAHRAAHLPYLVYLRHPSTGGVFASWASLGHLTLAEPGALIGFLGPRVYEALEGQPFPAGVQTAENLAAHGLVDAVVAPDQLGGLIGRMLDALSTGFGSDPVAEVTSVKEAAGEQFGEVRVGGEGEDSGESKGREPGGDSLGGAGRRLGEDEAGGEPGTEAGGEPGTGDAWAAVQLTRQSGYPDARDLIAATATNVVTLHERSTILALARIGGSPVVLAAQDRRGPPAGPDALRVVRRGVRLAADLGLPLVTVIDTAGAELSVAAEEAGLAAQIAGTLADLLTTRSPTVSVLLGQGTGGAALALLPADRTVAAAAGWLAPLAPEGASAIMYRDTGHAAGLARRQGIRAADLAAAGVVDEIVSAAGASDLVRELGGAVRRALAELARQNPGRRLAARASRYRHLDG